MPGSNAQAAMGSPTDPVKCTSKVHPGAGTESSPYLINGVSEYKCFVQKAQAYSTVGQVWALNADLDLTGQVGRQFMLPQFQGVFDGRFHRIKGLSIDCVTDRSLCANNVGLFQYLDAATLKNLYLTDTLVKVGPRGNNQTVYNVGALVGAASASTIHRVSVTAGVETAGDINTDGLSGVGGAIGYISTSTVSESGVVAMLTGNSTPYSIAQLVGRSCNSAIDNSFARGDVYGGWFIGGLTGGCGNGSSTHKTTNSYYVGNLQKSNSANFGGCQFMAPLGTAQGESLTEGRTVIQNSFWSGTSSCNPVFYTPAIFPGSTAYAWSGGSLSTDVWASGWPQLKWMVQNPPAP